jgi:threonine synthase
VIIASTASPFKFGGNVAQAVLPEFDFKSWDEFEILDRLAAATGQDVPEGIKSLQQKPIIHDTICNANKMDETIYRFLDL